jgi:hypothetical protein
MSNAVRRAQAFFIVSSGRSGTQMMEKLLASLPDVEMHHEYLCTHVQPLAVRYYMGLTDLDYACAQLQQWHGAAVHYCQKRLWGDSSNKLSWLISALDRVFPDAKFIHLVRDGRKVVSSFWNKLKSECYDDDSTAVLQAWLDAPHKHPQPPPEKKYWWNLPRPGTAFASEFRSYDQFQRICFHWHEVNRIILEQLSAIPAQRQRFFRLEELVADERQLKDMMAFLEVPYQADYFQTLARPHNVSVPKDFPLTAAQQEVFQSMAGPMMETLGYAGRQEYRVVYHPESLRRSARQGEP